MAEANAITDGDKETTGPVGYVYMYELMVFCEAPRDRRSHEGYMHVYERLFSAEH